MNGDGISPPQSRPPYSNIVIQYKSQQYPLSQHSGAREAGPL